MLRVDILHDVGDSLSPIIDLGQVEGAFVQGAGWLTLEELRWDETDGPGRGRLLTQSASTYKLPSFSEMPEEFNVRLLEHAAEDGVVYGSKAVGEPPLMLAFSVREAIREAVGGVRAGAGTASSSARRRRPRPCSGRSWRRAPRAMRPRHVPAPCRDRALDPRADGLLKPGRRRGLGARPCSGSARRARRAVIVTLAMVRGHAPRNGGAKMVVSRRPLLRHRRRRQPRGDRDRPCPRDARRRQPPSPSCSR